MDVRNQLDTLPVYRDASVRRKRLGSDYDTQFVVDNNQVILDEFWLHSLWPSVSNNLAPELNKKRGCIGVCYYKDLQDFFKRLRQNLIRHYGYDGKFTSFSCSEYGGHSFRPHFHSLIFIPKSAESTFRSAIVESWPFADKHRTAKFIEVARDCASYVSSYVNGGSCVHSLLALPMFKQKHSYSKAFGLGVDCFNLASLLEKVKSGDLRYYSKVVKNGQTTIGAFPIPKYVVNRFFPRFKGFSRLSPDEVLDVVRDPENYSLYKFREGLDITKDDFCKFKTRLNNAFDYYRSQTGNNRIDYSFDYSRIWTIYKSVVLRDSHNETTNQ